MSAVSALALDAGREVDAQEGLYRPTVSRGLIATWRRRIEFRRELKRLATVPGLIADIGLTMAQVQAEVEKPFWRE